MSKLKREIVFKPAFDKRDPDPKKNYGIHGADMIWYLKGDKGAIQFVTYTGWHLPDVAKELTTKGSPYREPTGADVGYHSPKPIYDGQSSMKCNLIEGGKCYYDGSGLHAVDMLKILIAEGSEAVWTKLEEYYKEVFD